MRVDHALFLQLASAKLHGLLLAVHGCCPVGQSVAPQQQLNRKSSTHLVFRVLYCCRGGESKSRMAFLPRRAHSSKNTPGSLDVIAHPNPRRSHRPACISTCAHGLPPLFSSTRKKQCLSLCWHTHLRINAGTPGRPGSRRLGVLVFCESVL